MGRGGGRRTQRSQDPFKVYSLVIFGTFKELHDHHHNITIGDLQHYRNKKTPPILISSLFLYSNPKPQATTNLPFVSIDLPSLEVSCSQDHTLYGLLCLFLLFSTVFSRPIHVLACVSTSPFFYGWMVFHCVAPSHFVYPFTANGHLGWFHISLL